MASSHDSRLSPPLTAESNHDRTALGDRESRRGRVDRVTWAVAIANLIAQIGIIVTGGLVRLTGSGLGCSTWPMCEPGSFTPEFSAESSLHSYIEFGNRTLTGLLGIIAVALVIMVYRRQPTASRPAGLKRLTWVPLAGVAIQAVVGGITVLVELHPAWVGFHMFISILIVAVSAYLLVRLADGDERPRFPFSSVTAHLRNAMVATALLMTLLGTVVTGAGPHSGDEEAPYRWALDPVGITRVHSVAVYVFVAVLLILLAYVFGVVGKTPRGQEHLLAQVRPRAVRWGLVVFALTLLNAIVGFIQHATELPETLVLIHMTLAGITTAAVATFAAVMTTRSAGERAPAATTVAVAR